MFKAFLENLKVTESFGSNFFLEHAKEVYFFSHHSNQRVNNMGITMSPKKIPQCHVMAAETAAAAADHVEYRTGAA